MKATTRVSNQSLCCVKAHGKTTDSYQPGNVGTKYIMVFECPTANEKREQRPVVGATGFNLCRLLELVRKGFLTLAQAAAEAHMTEEEFNTKISNLTV